MKHIYNKGSKAKTLLLLHGTGGNEREMLPLGERIDRDANILSVRGNVSESGMPRFFRRLSPGVFDEEDLIQRTNELNHFITEASLDYSFDRAQVIAVGYSNGANIAASLLFHDQDAVEGAILFHPMVPLRSIELPDLSGKKVFIGAGVNDPMSADHETKELTKMLESAGADVEVFWHHSGHSLTQEELEKAIQWYKTL